MKNRKKIIFNIVFFLILFPPALAMWLLLFFVVIDNSDAIDGIDYGPQLSEKTVLSLFDNLSNLAITGHADFKDDKFCLKFCKDTESYRCDSFQNETIAYIAYKNNFLGLIKNDYEDGSYYDPLVKYPQTIYYDTIDNCTKYYEISYNPKLNKALCIDGNISRINPFSAKIIRTNK